VFGCSDDDLVVHKATDGSWSYRIPRDKRESESEPVLDAFELLSGWNRIKRSLSLAELIEIVITESRFVEACLSLPDGEQGAANVLAIIDQARAFAGAGGGGLRAFTRWLATSSEQDAVEVDTGVVEEADNVVRLMTIHGAKGLEYPIVVLAGLAGQGREWMEAVPDEPDRDLHFRVGTQNRGIYATAGYDHERDAERDARDAELIRLLYVAATRARDQLVIPHMRNVKSPGPLMRALEDFLPSVDGHEVRSGGAWLLEADELDPIKKPSAARASARQKDVDGAIAKRDSWVTQREELLKEAGTERPLVIASSSDRQVRPLAAEASHSAAALLTSEGPPLKIGDALHLVMERVSLPDAEDLDEVVDSVCLEAGIPEHQAEMLELAKRCLTSPTVRRALELGTYHREVPFTVPSDGGFALGRVDFVFQEQQGLHVVDFKTDNIDPADVEAHTLERHSGQADIYASALAAAAARPVSEVTFVYCRSNAEVTVDVEVREQLDQGSPATSG
jgi:ATP-dependent exoDNAse (exonuclease V) beta subunit